MASRSLQDPHGLYLISVVLVGMVTSAMLIQYRLQELLLCRSQQSEDKAAKQFES